MFSPKGTEVQDIPPALEPFADPADILIVGYLNEIPPRDVDLHFAYRRVVPVADALKRMEGFRGNAYYTENALRVSDTDTWNQIEFWAKWAGGELLHANHFNTEKEPNV